MCVCVCQIKDVHQVSFLHTWLYSFLALLLKGLASLQLCGWSCMGLFLEPLLYPILSYPIDPIRSDPILFYSIGPRFCFAWWPCCLCYCAGNSSSREVLWYSSNKKNLLFMIAWTFLCLSIHFRFLGFFCWLCSVCQCAVCFCAVVSVCSVCILSVCSVCQCVQCVSRGLC